LSLDIIRKKIYQLFLLPWFIEVGGSWLSSDKITPRPAIRLMKKLLATAIIYCITAACNGPRAEEVTKNTELKTLLYKKAPDIAVRADLYTVNSFVFTALSLHEESIDTYFKGESEKATEIKTKELDARSRAYAEVKKIFSSDIVLISGYVLDFTRTAVFIELSEGQINNYAKLLIDDKLFQSLNFPLLGQLRRGDKVNVYAKGFHDHFDTMLNTSNIPITERNCCEDGFVLHLVRVEKALQ